MAIQEPKSAITYPKLTVEVGLYAIVAALALALRLYRLGLAPLSTSEAALALAALRGTAIPAGASPLLYWVNALLFSIFGGGDTLARLLPALACCASASGGSAHWARQRSWRSLRLPSSLRARPLAMRSLPP
jgi:predicted membrane-bound mannosyltransferase